MGLFSSFHTDRGSHYFFTPKAGEKVSRNELTQVGRALQDLGIRHIASYSPQGRGRMERVWGTLQGRLPRVLRLEEIATIEAANRFLAQTYIERGAPVRRRRAGHFPRTAPAGRLRRRRDPNHEGDEAAISRLSPLRPSYNQEADI